MYKELNSLGRSDPNQVIYKADLQRVGSLINESLMALAEYAKFKNWDATKDIIISQNLLGKKSSQTLKGILAAIQKRFFTSHDTLPKVDILACAVSKNIPRVVKTQILYPYICEADPLIKKLLLNLVGKRIEKSSTLLTKLDVLHFLENEQQTHPELRKWSDYLKGRWVRGFLAFLRDFGIMEKAPSNRLLKPIIRLESFTFFLLNLLDKKVSPAEVFNNEVWILYFLKNDEIEHFLVDAQGRGWIYYSKAGDIIELKPKYQLGEWINECLG